jgi:hypothetical protein
MQLTLYHFSEFFININLLHLRKCKHRKESKTGHPNDINKEL